MKVHPALVRAARPDDASAIRDLVRAAYAKWVPVIGREPMPMQADYVTAVATHVFALAFLPQGLAGLIEVVPRHDHLWIENLAVHPDAQGQGLARLLLGQAEAMARAEGTPALRLLTNEAFAGNVAVYRHMGFAVTLRDPFRGGFTIHMQRLLA